MAATHNGLINLSYTLDPAPVAAANFGTVLLLAEDLSFSTDRFRAYPDYPTAVADGDLTAAALEALQVAFSSVPRPAEVLVANVDVTGLEDYDTALLDAIAEGAQFFGVVLESRTAADQLAVAAAVETLEKVLVIQTSDGDALTVGWPSALAAVEDNVNTAVVYHDDDNEWADVAWLVNRLAFDFDLTAPGGQAQLRGVAAADVTTAERGLALANNINLPLEFGPASAYLSHGTNAEGRAFEHIWSVYWFIARTRALLTRLKLSYDNAGLKIPMTRQGQIILESTIQQQIDIAVDRGHFRAEQFRFAFPDPIPTADITSRDLKAQVYITLESGAKSFAITFNFSATDVLP